jgi:hypothetical protein
MSTTESFDKPVQACPGAGPDERPLQILYWLKSGVTVRPRFGFQETTADTVRKRFGLNFVASLSDAMGHRG